MAYLNTKWKRPKLILSKTELGNWHWTAVLPTQLHNHATRKEALSSLAQVLQQLKEGKVTCEEFDRTSHTPCHPLMGGMTHIMSHLPVKKTRKARKVSKK